MLVLRTRIACCKLSLQMTIKFSAPIRSRSQALPKVDVKKTRAPGPYLSMIVFGFGT